MTDEARVWWAVTYRGTAEMTVWVEASSATEAKAKAENGDYDDAAQIEFVKGRPYTMKARRSDHTPGDAP